ncbi:MAG: hypothetical protein F6K10_12145 [Moorea sp. SIO2B7]|nr:hypothetical protein [Moorena sp. SIO2B7]
MSKVPATPVPVLLTVTNARSLTLNVLVFRLREPACPVWVARDAIALAGPSGSILFRPTLANRLL